MLETVSLLLASQTVTKVVDWIRNAATSLNWAPPKWVWNTTAFAVGILGCLIFNVEDVVLPASLKFKLSETALDIVTGFVLGAGGSFMHEINHWISARAHRG